MLVIRPHHQPYAPNTALQPDPRRPVLSHVLGILTAGFDRAMPIAARAAERQAVGAHATRSRSSLLIFFCISGSSRAVSHERTYQPWFDCQWRSAWVRQSQRHANAYDSQWHAAWVEECRLPSAGDADGRQWRVPGRLGNVVRSCSLERFPMPRPNRRV